MIFVMVVMVYFFNMAKKPQATKWIIMEIDLPANMESLGKFKKTWN